MNMLYVVRIIIRNPFYENLAYQLDSSAILQTAEQFGKGLYLQPYRGGVSQTLRIIVVKLSPRSELDRQNKMAIKHLYNDVDLHKLLASARLVRRVYGCNVYTAIIHERVH